jgi:DNA-binding winged helix-turn-helix (wHTH) protein
MTSMLEMPSFRIDPVNLCLWRSNAAGVEERLNLTPKTFDVLRYLVENPGRLVTHDELLAALWRDVHVQPEVLKSHVLAIRNALGDKSSSPRFIETQRGRGYRFIGEMNGLASAATRPQSALELGVFAGRSEPLNQLLGLFQRAASGESQMVFVSGEPGIGKTTLIQQFLVQVRGHLDLVVAQGHCIESFAGAEPYYPLLEVFWDLCKGASSAGIVRSLPTLAPSWASQMPAQFSAEQRTALRQQIMPSPQSVMVLEACTFLETLAAERPFVLVLEDLHWADFATIDFLSALCRRRSAAKLLLIATYRLEDLKTARHPLKQMTRDLALRKYASEIELAPLSTTAIAEVLSGRKKTGAVASEFTRFIEERTGGNPLFMRVTLEYLQERGNVARASLGWRPLVPFDGMTLETPPTLGRMIEAKTEGMTDEQRRVLEAASAAGDHFDPVTAARAADMDEQSFEAICESFTSSIIRRNGLLTLPNNELVRTYSFNHVIFRQVLYDQIGQVRRAYLHRTIGEKLEQIYPPDQRNDLAVQLAQHFAFARDWSRALNYLRSAIRVANSRFARRDALAILDQAVKLSANLLDSARIPAEIEFLERRAALEAAVHDSKARETYAQLAEKAGRYGDIDAQCRALLGRSYAVSWNDLGDSLRVLDEVFALCERQTDPIQRDFTRINAYVRRLWGAGWDRASAQNCEEAVIRLRRHGDRLTIARANANFSMICLISTRYQEAYDLAVESYHIISETGQNAVEADLARFAWMRHLGAPWSLCYLGQFGAALAELDASVAACEKNGDVSATHSFHVYRGLVLFHALDFEGVLQACAPVANLSTKRADAAIRVLPVERRIALVFCGLAEAGLGNNAAALDYLRGAETEMERQPVHLDWYWRLALEWGMVGILIADGDHMTAKARAERLCGLAAQTDERAWRALAWEARARAALACGDASEAAKIIANAVAAWEGVKVPLAEWRVHATGAMIYKAVGDTDRAGLHSRRGAAIRKQLAETLPEGHSLRVKFESRDLSSELGPSFGWH